MEGYQEYLLRGYYSNFQFVLKPTEYPFITDQLLYFKIKWSGKDEHT